MCRLLRLLLLVVLVLPACAPAAEKPPPILVQAPPSVPSPSDQLVQIMHRLTGIGSQLQTEIGTLAQKQRRGELTDEGYRRAIIELIDRTMAEEAKIKTELKSLRPPDSSAQFEKARGLLVQYVELLETDLTLNRYYWESPDPKLLSQLSDLNSQEGKVLEAARTEIAAMESSSAR